MQGLKVKKDYQKYQTQTIIELSTNVNKQLLFSKKTQEQYKIVNNYKLSAE